ncbi:unnamed protein product [Ilex paraguariensis]|uniref:GRAM domain-containing protein n=1 Tax=Ilex paraguariensis TaxID=185542 RepID=A0ABC8UGY2_9AQUA
MKDHQFDHHFPASPMKGSFETTRDSPSSLSEPVSSFRSPSSSDGSPTFKTNKGDQKNLGRKAGSYVYRIREHGKNRLALSRIKSLWCIVSIFFFVKLGPKFSETVKGKLNLGAKIIQQGGRENIFRKIFIVIEGEKLLKASQCYLSTTAGPVAGILFISTEKVAFCSERSIAIPTTGGFVRTPYKVVIPIKKIKTAIESENVNKPAEKYIEIITEDNFEFWFMGFVRYEKALMNLQKAISIPR